MRSTRNPPSLPRLNVLVAEDSLVDRRILESMLTEQKKFAVSFRTTGSLKSTKHLLVSHSFDVVILDLNLSDSQGEKTLVSLRADFPGIPIVVNTGSYEDDIGIRTLGIGAQDFLIKGKYNAYMLQRVLRYAVERKRLESELKRAYEELKETQSQLTQSEKMKVVGALASGVAHEVKNPLATIMYGITYLGNRLKNNGQDVDKVLQTVKQAADRANEIVNDLLDFAHTAKLKRQKANLNEVIERALTLVHHEFFRKHIVLVKKLDPNIPTAYIDNNRVEQVIVNLLLNAIHAVKNKGVIEVRSFEKKLSSSLHEIPAYSRNGFKPHQHVLLISIEDNGCGVTQAQVKKIFEPFFTTREAKGGIGLGLSVSQEIIKNHHGAIFLRKRKKGGTQAALVFKL